MPATWAFLITALGNKLLRTTALTRTKMPEMKPFGTWVSYKSSSSMKCYRISLELLLGLYRGLLWLCQSVTAE
jgi:hypothetical protein